MFHLFSKIVLREMEEGTYRPRNRELINQSFGKTVGANLRVRPIVN
jgi:hypothetical protein